MTTDLAVQPEEIDRRRRERAYRLAVIEIPLLRTIGAVIICVAVYLNNRYFLGDFTNERFWAIAVIAVSYSAVSWICLRLFYRRLQPFDLSLFFLIVDVPMMTLAIYGSGAERSWLFLAVLVRAADQAVTTFRRCFGFVVFGAVCYGTMEAWVVFIDKRPIAAGVFAAKIIFVFLFGLYMALTARTAERWRASRSSALRLARDLVRQVEEHSQELDDARARAEEASAAKSEFLAHMSHEMRTPLHGVIGMLQLAIEDETSPRRIRQLEMARHSAEALLATIEDILDFSKIEARKIELEPVYFSIRDLVTDTIKPLGVSAAAKGLLIAAGVAPDVPESVWGDPARLRQILVNLVGNAIKFTDAGEVVLRASMIDQSVRFEVRDTGIGIPEEQRNTIFEPFTQADNTRSRRHVGTGLGLAIVSRLVNTMGGALRLESKPGAGTVIAIELPLPYDRYAVPTRKPRPELAGKSVAVVEPNTTSREFIAEMLRTGGLNVSEFTSSAGMASQRFDCIVSADASVSVEPAVIISSPLVAPPDDRPRVTRPVVERELLDAIAWCLGAKPEKSAAIATKRRFEKSGLHVLVAEDEAVSKEFAVEALRRMMHRVTVVSDGEEALWRLERENFDIVLMDVSMPKLDGREVTRRYRELERGSRTPIVALTAHSRREDRERCLEAGMDAVLSKPIELKQLEEVIQSLTGAEPIVNAVGGNIKLLVRVSEAFARQTPVLLGQIRDAIDQNDGEALYQSAHKMKSAVGNFDGDASFGLVVMLESAARERDFKRAATLLRRLQPALSALERRINAACSGTVAAT